MNPEEGPLMQLLTDDSASMHLSSLYIKSSALNAVVTIRGCPAADVSMNPAAIFGQDRTL